MFSTLEQKKHARPESFNPSVVRTQVFICFRECSICTISGRKSKRCRESTTYWEVAYTEDDEHPTHATYSNHTRPHYITFHVYVYHAGTNAAQAPSIDQSHSADMRALPALTIISSNTDKIDYLVVEGTSCLVSHS